jgi:hypothetical protein
MANPHHNRLRGPMDKALVYGTRDSGFDPQRSRFHFLFLAFSFWAYVSFWPTGEAKLISLHDSKLKRFRIEFACRYCARCSICS